MHTKGLMASRGKVRKGREREEEEGKRGEEREKVVVVVGDQAESERWGPVK